MVFHQPLQDVSIQEGSLQEQEAEKVQLKTVDGQTAVIIDLRIDIV
jgi:hypothetical protein